MNEANQLTLIGLIGGTWAVPDVDRQPLIRLECWQVFRLDNGDHHLVGWHDAGGEGRVSSRVEAFDPTRRQALTCSGRTYELCGPDGCNGDAQYVWKCWLEARGHQPAEDVTGELVLRIEEGRH